MGAEENLMRGVQWGRAMTTAGQRIGTESAILSDHTPYAMYIAAVRVLGRVHYQLSDDLN